MTCRIDHRFRQAAWLCFQERTEGQTDRNECPSLLPDMSSIEQTTLTLTVTLSVTRSPGACPWRAGNPWPAVAVVGLQVRRQNESGRQAQVQHPGVSG